jgi:hypothetical protein
MSSFSTWAFRLKNHLTSAGVSIQLGHAQELLASGLNHNTRASFLATEAELLPRAQHVVFLAEAIRNRAAVLGIDLSPVRSLDEILDILGDPDGAIEPTPSLSLQLIEGSGPISDHSFRERVFQLIEQGEHNLPSHLARQLGSTRARTIAAIVYKEESLTEAQREWVWTFSGWTRRMDLTSGLQIPVSGVLSIPKIGRTLLGSACITRLDRTGDPQPFDDEMDQGDVYGYDSSD